MTDQALTVLREKISEVARNRDQVQTSRTKAATDRAAAVDAADAKGVSQAAKLVLAADAELAGYDEVLASLREKAEPLEGVEAYRLHVLRTEEGLRLATEAEQAKHAIVSELLVELEATAERALALAEAAVRAQAVWHLEFGKMARHQATLSGYTYSGGGETDDIDAACRGSQAVQLAVQNRRLLGKPSLVATIQLPPSKN